MKLSKTIAFCIKNNNLSSIWHINSNFNYGCRNQNINVSIFEIFHLLVFFIRLHFAMQKINPIIWKYFFKSFCFTLHIGLVTSMRFFNKSTYPINLLFVFKMLLNYWIQIIFHIYFVQNLSFYFLTAFWQFR